MGRATLRTFSFGLFLATAIFTSFYYFGSANLAKNETREENVSFPTQEEMIALLEQDGFVIFTLEEMKAMEKDGEDEKEDEKDNTSQVTHAILHIEQGMSSEEVINQLTMLQIISEEESLKEALEEKNAFTAIQTGYYQLHSEMSVDEIVATITKSE